VSATVTIAPRFNGPPSSAHGGYSAGLVGTAVDGPAEVTLLAPPPLATPLRIAVLDGGGAAELRLADDGGAAELRLAGAGGAVIATAVRTTVDVGPAPRADVTAIRAAMPSREVLRTYHPFPTCFGCGPDRDAGDGLCLFPGLVDPVTALWGVTWRPDGGGPVDPLMVWAALDCPSSAPAQDPTGQRPIVLGRLAVDIREPVPADGAEHAILSAPLTHLGRKRTNAVWLVDANGRELAVGRATWIELKPVDAATRRGDGR